MKLYYYPLSSYSQKALLALYEKQVAFTPEILYPGDPVQRAELTKLNPLGKVPVLVLDDGWKIPESTIIIEYLDGQFSTGTRLIPEDRDRARQTRFHDRLADLYVNEAMTKLFFETRKPEAKRDAEGVAAAHARLDTVFAAFDNLLAKRTWIMGDSFTMADCALIPPLAYCRMLHPFERWPNLTAYAARALARPSFAKIQAEAAPYVAKAQAAATA